MTTSGSPDPPLDPLLRFIALRDRPSRLVIGLLSGTIADGTDAALCEIAGANSPFDAAWRYSGAPHREEIPP